MDKFLARNCDELFHLCDFAHLGKSAKGFIGLLRFLAVTEYIPAIDRQKLCFKNIVLPFLSYLIQIIDLLIKFPICFSVFF